MWNTMPNAATEPSKQRRTPNPLSMLNALTMPTPPATKQPRTAKPMTVSALELRPGATLRFSACVCVLIKMKWCSMSNAKLTDDEERAKDARPATRT